MASRTRASTRYFTGKTVAEKVMRGKLQSFAQHIGVAMFFMHMLTPVYAGSIIDPTFKVKFTSFNSTDCSADTWLDKSIVLDGQCSTPSQAFESFSVELFRVGGLEQYGDCRLAVFESNDCTGDNNYEVYGVNNKILAAGQDQVCFDMAEPYTPNMLLQSAYLKCVQDEDISERTDVVWWSCLGLSLGVAAVLFGLAIFINLRTNWLVESKEERGRQPAPQPAEQIAVEAEPKA